MAHYFVSDVHAGLVLEGRPCRSGERFAAWLDAVAPDAEEIYLLGDIFDFWFEYRQAIPKGYEPLLDKFKALTAQGIQLHFFPGNHDMWTLDYLSRECGLKIHTDGYYAEICGKKVYMEHGDRQSIGSAGERLMQWIFRSKFARAVARRTVSHRKIMEFGNDWSRSNRAKHTHPHIFKEEREGVVRFARKYLRKHEVDLFVFGHLHAPSAYELSAGTMLYVLGDWITEREPVYGRLDKDGFSLEKFNPK